MLTTVISLIISLAVLGIVYVLVKWILSLIEIPFPAKIVQIVFGVLAVIIVLKFVATLL